MCRYALAWLLGNRSQATDEVAVKTRLDQVANSFTANNAFMGTVLVVDGDRVLLDKGYGMADMEWEFPTCRRPN